MKDLIFYFVLSFFLTFFQFFVDPAPLFFFWRESNNFEIKYPNFFIIDFNLYTAAVFYYLFVTSGVFYFPFLFFIFICFFVPIIFQREFNRIFYTFLFSLFVWFSFFLFWFTDIRFSSFTFFHFFDDSDFRDFSIFIFNIAGDFFDFFIFIFFFSFFIFSNFFSFFLNHFSSRWFFRFLFYFSFLYFFGGEGFFIDFIVFLFLFFFVELVVFLSICRKIFFQWKLILFFFETGIQYKKFSKLL